MKYLLNLEGSSPKEKKSNHRNTDWAADRLATVLCRNRPGEA